MSEINVTYKRLDGSSTTVAAQEGISLMQAALDELLDGIVGECGGACMCATCHVYVAEEWLDRLSPIKAMENSMLDSAASPRKSNSRLGCQIILTPELDGLNVTLPETQV